LQRSQFADRTADSVRDTAALFNEADGSAVGSNPNPRLRERKAAAGIILARRVFFIAGVYGILVLLPQYFMESRLGRDFPPPITHPEHYYGFLGVALAWQVLFLIMGTDPIRYRIAMVPATLEKLSFGIACVVLFVQGRLSGVFLGAGMLDLVFAALFVVSFLATAKRD
jgi:hypothetical protein